MSNWRESYWKEALECALEEHAIDISDAQITAIAKDLMVSSEMEREASGELAIPSPLRSQLDNMKRDHAKEIVRLEAREECYRQSVATRRGVPINNVTLNQYGIVEVLCH